MLKGSPFVRGLYGAQLERALGVLSAGAVAAGGVPPAARRADAVLDAATDHLGLPRFTTYPSMQHRMASPTANPGGRPPVAAIEKLVRRYADDLALFERLSGST